jgi:hypothetical protein
MRSARTLVLSLVVAITAVSARADIISIDKMLGDGYETGTSSSDRADKLTIKSTSRIARQTGDMGALDGDVITIDLTTFGLRYFEGLRSLEVGDRNTPTTSDVAAALQSGRDVQSWDRNVGEYEGSAESFPFQFTNPAMTWPNSWSHSAGVNLDHRWLRYGRPHNPTAPGWFLTDQGDDTEGSTSSSGDTVRHGISAVPEPSSILLLGGGMIGLVKLAFRKARG